MEERDGRYNKRFGRKGELIAAEYLKNHGYKVLAMNYRCRFGELDIVALSGEVLCFVEVKSRTSLFYGLPCEAVTSGKLTRIQRCAYHYMDELKRTGGSVQYSDIRIEIVELLFLEGREYIRHIKHGIGAA